MKAAIELKDSSLVVSGIYIRDVSKILKINLIVFCTASSESFLRSTSQITEH